MLDATQLAEFEELGYTRLKGFTASQAERMQAVAWRELERRYGVVPDTPTAWPVWLAGMKSTKHHHAFDAIGGPALSSALDQLLGEGRWKQPKHWGQVMVTPPAPRPRWQVPHRLWHIDFAYAGTLTRLQGVKVFVRFGDVAPQGGGTLLIERSHQMTARYLADVHDGDDDYRRTRDRFLRHAPWLRALTSPNDDGDRTARFMETEGEVDGVLARVVELTGEAGDIVLTHPWVHHCAAPNAGTVPRFMRGKNILRAAPAQISVSPPSTGST